MWPKVTCRDVETFCKLHTVLHWRESLMEEREENTQSVVPSIICACEQKGCLYYVHMKICLISLRTEGEWERVWVGMFSMTCWCWMGGGEESVSLCLFECFCVLALFTGSNILHPAQIRVACCCVPRYRIFCTEQHCRDIMYPEEPVRLTRRRTLTHLHLHYAWIHI